MCRFGHLGRDQLTNMSAGAVLDVYLFYGKRELFFSAIYISWLDGYEIPVGLIHA